MKVLDVSIKDIEVVENVRISVQDKEIQSLMESIKQHGLEQPIGVGQTKSKKFVLLYGHRRLTACTKLGWNTIPAVVSDEPDAKDLILLNITENIQRRDITPMELGRIVHVLKSRHNMTTEEVAARLSVGTHRLVTALSVYSDIPKEMKEKVQFLGKGESARKGMIPATLAHKVSNIKRTHQLTQKQTTDLLQEVREKDLTFPDLEIIAMLMAEGVTPAQALKERARYKVLRLDVLLYTDEIDALTKKTGRSAVRSIQDVVYGITPALTKPKSLQRKNESR